MLSCDLCGKGFKYPYLLLRHLHRKNQCKPIKYFVDHGEKVNPNGEKVNPDGEKVNPNGEKVNPDGEKVNPNGEKVNPNGETQTKQFSCTKCERIYVRKKEFSQHILSCAGLKTSQCPVCKKTFSSKQGKSKHLKNVKCSPPEEFRDLREENLALKKELAILKASKQSIVTTTNNNNTNINIIKYEIKYNPETRCLTTDDPDAPFPELLCFNGFKMEAAGSRLKNIDQEQLQQHIHNVRHRKDFYSLYAFFFRNVDNRRLQMFNLGKNNNTTHAQVFNEGAIEKVEKSHLFENVCLFIGQYLLNMSMDNIDVISMLKSEHASKAAFLEVTKDRSHVFEYYKTLE